MSLNVCRSARIVLAYNRCKTSISRQIRQRSTEEADDVTTETDYGKHADNVKPFESIPGPSYLPLIGILHHSLLPGGVFYKMDTKASTDKMYELYGSIVRRKFTPKFQMVSVFHPEDIETVFRNEGPYPVRLGFEMVAHYNKKRRNNVQGILGSHMENWKRLRSNVQQKMLRPKAVSAYFDQQYKVGEDLMHRISELRDANGDVEDLRPDLYNYATEAIGVVCFNRRIGALRNPSEDSETARFIQAVRTVFECLVKGMLGPPFYLKFETPLFKKLAEAQTVIIELSEKYTNIALQERMNNAEDIQGEGGDLIPYLMTKSELSTEEVLAIISEFFFGGVDTTSHYVMFALYALAKNPDVQEKLRTEIDSIVPAGTPVTSSAMGKMSYLKAVLKETLRYLPVTPGNNRVLTKDIVLGGYHVPKGTSIAIHNDWVGRQEKYFPRASDFIPERWLRNSGMTLPHQFANAPMLNFGFGQRQCIGKRFAEQETGLALVQILRKYKVEYPHGELKTVAGFVYVADNPMRFRFLERT